MESERELAKLRRLRYRTDYSIRLFLAAMRELSPRETGDGARRGWRQGLAFCPRCGHSEREPARRRARLN